MSRLALPGGGVFMAGDCPDGIPGDGIEGVSLVLNDDSIAAAKRAFDALAEGGQITLPMQPAFWTKSWGMLVDRYGAAWIVDGELLPI